MGNQEKSAREMVEEFDSRQVPDEYTKEPFKITGTLANDLNEVCQALNMSEPKAIAFGLGILLKAKDVRGEIHIIDDKGKTVYRSKRIG